VVEAHEDLDSTGRGGQWYDRTVQMIDLIAQRVVPLLDAIAKAQDPAYAVTGTPIVHVHRHYLDGQELSNAITESDELAGGAI